MSEEIVKYTTSAIAEMTNGIILANYEEILQVQAILWLLMLLI